MIENIDDENESVIWIEKNKTVIFNCGCCDNCECDDNEPCSCGCSCQISEDLYNIDDFTIDIIEINKERKVRMILNVSISSMKNIKISLDIESSLYLQIAKDLFN